MLHLAVFTFLQSAVYIAVGADRPYPSTNGEGGVLNPDWYATGIVIPDSEQSLSFVAKDEASPFLKNRSVPFKTSELYPSKLSHQACKKVPPIIEYFSNNFVARVSASEKVRDAFQILQGFTKESFISFAYNLILGAMSSVGGPDAIVSARLAAIAVAINFDYLDKKDAAFRIYGDSVGSYLFYRGYLLPCNVEYLLQENFRQLERAVNNVRNPTPEKIFTAIAEAFVDFFSSLGLFDMYSTTMVTGIFLIPWYETLPYLKNSSAPLKPSESSPSNWNSEVCRKVHPIIEYFSNNFVERVMASEKVREAFQSRGFNAKSFSSFFLNYVYGSISSVGGLDAPVSAKLVSDAVAINFDKVEKDLLTRIFGQSVGSYLFHRGYFSPSNVECLSEEYFKFIERAISDVRNPTWEGNFTAISDAFVDFLSSLGLYNMYSTVMVSGFFVIPWYEL